ncbi:RICIN domain-containing protein [Paenibacillus marchantiophytorum]|nr:RICIN domain-containing protein [Paenibacillus marchantiophytorum]
MKQEHNFSLPHVSTKIVTVLLAALIAITTFVVAQPASASSSQISNAVDKYAADGEQIWSQGGWMMKEGDTYYWYGGDLSQPKTLPDGTDNTAKWEKRVSAYTSTDLVNWTAYRRIVDFPSIDTYRTAHPGTTVPAFDKNNWFGRPVVQYNSVIGKYVMFLEWKYPGGYRNAISIWYSDSPVSQFEFQKLIPNPGGYYGNGDLGSFFTDDDGVTYMTQTVDWKLTSSGTPDYNSGIYIGRVDTTLNANNEYEISITRVKLLESSAPYKEATTLFKVGSKYYLLASQTNGWRSSQTYYYTADSVTGDWSSSAKVGTTSWQGSTYDRTSPTGSNSFDTQFDQILPIQGTAGMMYLFIGDRWNNLKESDGTFGSYGPGRNQWYPLTFDSSGKPIINGYQQWYTDLTAGTWSPTAPAAPINTQLTYAIVNSNSSKALAITNDLTTADATLQQRAYTGAASQSWKFVDAGSGYYRIQNTNSGLFMDIRNASTASGGYSIQWTASNNNSQQWQLIDAGSGYYKIKNRNSGKVLGMSNGSTDDSAAVIQWEEAGSANQTWRFDAVAPIDLTKTYSILNRNSSKSLGTVGNATVTSTNIEQRTYTGAASQSWQFEYTNGYYKIKNVNSGTYMDIASSATFSGANSVIHTASSSNSQLWQLVDVGGSFYKLKNVNSGLMLGIDAGSTADGKLNKQWTPSSSLNQNWSFTVLNP